MLGGVSGFVSTLGRQKRAAFLSWRDKVREAIDAASAEQDLLLAHLGELTKIEPLAGEEARLAEARGSPILALSNYLRIIEIVPMDR